jgi:hypothetical protein
MQPIAIHASWIADPWRAVAQILLGATLVAALLSYMGVFGLDDDPVVIRTAYLVVVSWVGAAFGMLAYRVARRVAWARERFWARVLVADLLITIPSGVTVWASTLPFGSGFGLSELPIFFLNSLLIYGAFIAAVVAPSMDAAARRAEVVHADARPANFMDRLPARLHGAELWALKAEDHYLRVLTSKGDALIRLRIADALRELGAIEGAQTHRSWWVARAAVREAKRADGRASLILPNGSEAAVSRAYARALRKAGWY